MQTCKTVTFDKSYVTVCYECMVYEDDGWNTEEWFDNLKDAQKWFNGLDKEVIENKSASVDVVVNLLARKDDSDGIAEDGDVLYRLQVLPDVNPKANMSMSKTHKVPITLPIIVEHSEDTKIKVKPDYEY